MLRCLYESPRWPGPGRAKRYDGVMNVEDLSQFECLELNEGTNLYIKTLNHPRFKRDLRVVVVVNTKSGGYELLFSTDTTLDARTIYFYYKARFQPGRWASEIYQSYNLHKSDHKHNTTVAAQRPFAMPAIAAVPIHSL